MEEKNKSFTKEELWKIFLKYLRINGFYEEYYRNYKQKEIEWNICRNGSHISQLNPNDFVLYAFKWIESDSGQVFWENIDADWRNKLSLIKISKEINLKSEYGYKT